MNCQIHRCRCLPACTRSRRVPSKRCGVPVLTHYTTCGHHHASGKCLGCAMQCSAGLLTALAHKAMSHSTEILGVLWCSLGSA